MNTSKIIKGVVGGGRYTVTAPIVKEDYGLYLKIEGLELPATYEVDFSNSEHNGTSVTMIGNADGVLIPRQFIDSGKDVFAFLYHVGDNYGRTVFKFRIPNKLRPDRTDETPTPEEQSTIDQAISALNSAVEQTAQDVIDADASAQSASQSAESAEASAMASRGWAESAEDYAQSAEQSELQASASATASAQSASQSAQIKNDVDGMVDDAQGYANASAQSATASANSASQASASAQSASGYASQAQTSAQTASTKASEASGYASTASAKATESAQSATSAQGYAQTAEQAKEDAQTAQGLAEGARDDSEQIKSDVQDLADGIDTRLVDVEDDILKAFPTDTASGAVASFTDGADGLPLKSLVVDIDPVQDLSQGDPSPENICPISGWTQVEVNHSDADMTNPTTITIDLGQTVYGGKLDVLSGELTIDRAMVDLGTLNWSYGRPFGGTAYLFYSMSLTGIAKFVGARDIPNAITSIYIANSANAMSGNYANTNLNFTLYNNWVVIHNDAYTDYTAFKTAMNGVQLVYELATPIEIQLTPNQINSLLGTNNILADTGDTACEYRADPDLYIQRKMPEVNVDDVQINGTSIVSDGVAGIPIASSSALGVMRISGNGLVIQNGILRTNPASSAQIKEETHVNNPITPKTQHESVFYGLAKTAGHDEKNSTLALGTYTDEAKVAIQKMLGLYKAPYRLIKTIEITEETGTITIVADDNGDVFALTDVIVFFDSVVATGTSNGMVALNNETFADRPFVTIANLYNTTAQIRSAMLSVDGGRFVGQSSTGNYSNSYTAVTVQQNKNACGIIQHDIIDALIIGSLNEHKFTSGTITVYGR